MFLSLWKNVPIITPFTLRENICAYSALIYLAAVLYVASKARGSLSSKGDKQLAKQK